ncbi:PHP domain-containing protein [Candidatus Woesearchaeota archaeon]|nr:PHP domain-containing protein [Candidatus Woesearchaeota archaeon]
MKMVKNSDLHTHSYYSDGRISPKELVRLAKKRGIKNLALTDHNSVKGVQEAVNEGKKTGVNIIPGVEIVCYGGEVLGYFININNKELIKKIKENGRRIEEKTKDRCKKLRKEGYDISFKEIYDKYPKARGNFNVFYSTYMLYLKGYGKETLKLSYMLNKKFKRKKIKILTVLQSIRLIKKAGGVPVLAHPWLGDVENNFKKMESYVKAGLKGIEINNGDRYPFKKKGINKRIRATAKRHNLILTSGSDFHGKEIVKLMPGNHDLGKNNCDEKIVNKLKELSNPQ